MEEKKTKKCSHCGKELPIEMFGKSNTTKDGYTSWCRPCSAEDARIRYAKKMEKKKAAQHAANIAPANATSFTTNDGKTYIKVEPKLKTLEEYSPRELLVELKRRGYVWSDMFVKQTVAWDKI